MYRKALSLRELENIINHFKIVTSDDVNIVVLPLDLDELTGEDDVDNNIPGNLEAIYQENSAI